MIWHDVQQNTEEWEALRIGKFTASSFSDLFAKKETATYKKAIRKVVYERLTGETPESFKNDWMNRGHELEPMAIEQYELQTFNTVTPGGFFEYNEWIGASPDGQVDDDGQIEVKCPAYNTFIDYLLDGKLPTDYFWQVHGQLFVTGRKYCDFVAYHPKLPLQIIRIFPDNSTHNLLRTSLNEAIAEASRIIEAIKAIK